MGCRTRSGVASKSRAAAPAGGDEAQERPLRPGQCREYMRRELAREFRGIVRGFVEGAKTGSCQHVKLATELVDTKRRSRSRVKNSAVRLLEEIEGREA